MLSLDAFAQLLASAMKVGSDGIKGQLQHVSYLFIAALLLMIKHEDAPFDSAELLQLPFYRFLKLLLRELLLRVEAAMLQPVLPGRSFFITRGGD